MRNRAACGIVDKVRGKPGIVNRRLILNEFIAIVLLVFGFAANDSTAFGHDFA